MRWGKAVCEIPFQKSAPESFLFGKGAVEGVGRPGIVKQQCRGINRKASGRGYGELDCIRKVMGWGGKCY